MTSTVRLLLLHGVGRCGRRRGTRSRRGAGWNYCGDRFALRDWLGCGNHGGLAVIDGGKLLAILGGLFAVLDLSGHRRNTLLAGGGQLRWSRLAGDAARAVVTSIVHGVVDGCVVDRGVADGAVVDLDVAVADVVDRTVVVEAVSIPVPALIASSRVTISIVNAAVVADVPAPIAIVVAIAMAGVSPPSGGPQITGFGWTRPRAGNPVIAV